MYHPIGTEDRTERIPTATTVFHVETTTDRTTATTVGAMVVTTGSGVLGTGGSVEQTVLTAGTQAGGVAPKPRKEWAETYARGSTTEATDFHGPECHPKPKMNYQRSQTQIMSENYLAKIDVFKWELILASTTRYRSTSPE